MRPPLSYVPLLPILLAFIAGILIAEMGLSLWWVIIPMLVATAMYWCKMAVSAICLMALSIGWINAELQLPKPLDSSIANITHVYTATVESASETETSRHLIVDIDAIGKCRLTIPSSRPEVEMGDIVSFQGKLSLPKNQHDLPDEWDMESFMLHQGIIATAYLQPEDIKIIGESTNWLWDIRRLQSKIISLLGKSSLSDDTTEFLVATITGDDSLLSPDSREDFTTAGLAHILALSGLHIGIIALVIAIALFPLYFFRQNHYRLIITIILLWVYAIMTGLSPSVTRAVIMTTVYFIGVIIQRHHSSMNALCFAALMILLFSPLSLYSIGFQLSFVAVISILLFTRRLNPISPRHRIGYYIMSMLSVSIAAMIGTGIIAAYYFHSFPLYFLVGNILIMLLLPIIIGGGVLLIIIESLGCDPQWLCAILDFTHDVISAIVEFSTSLPHASVTRIYFPAWLLIPYFATTASLLAWLVYRRLSLGIATIMLAIATWMLSAIVKPTFPETEYFIPRETYHTNIIARQLTNMYLFTTAHESEHQAIIDEANHRYQDYMGQRNIDSIILVSDTFDSPIISRRGKHIILDNKYFVIVDNDSCIEPSSVKPDYAIICRGFSGEIDDVAKVLSPDSILLSNDLHPLRHNRYMQQCSINNIPHRSLRNK